MSFNSFVIGWLLGLTLSVCRLAWALAELILI